MITKHNITRIFYLFTFLIAQDLENLSFGDDNSLDIATWNIEWFPKNDQITVDYVAEIISLLEPHKTRQNSITMLRFTTNESTQIYSVAP